MDIIKDIEEVQGIKYFIYKHINNINGKVYIGQTRQNPPSLRWAGGIQAYTYNSPTKFSNAIKKYGWENFSHEILCECTEKDVDDLEKYYIAFYNSTNDNFGYNIEYGGNALKKVPLETIEKHRQAGYNHTITEQGRFNISQARKKMVGWNHKESTKQKMSSNSGKTVEVSMLDLKYNLNYKFKSFKECYNHICKEIPDIKYGSLVCSVKYTKPFMGRFKIIKNEYRHKNMSNTRVMNNGIISKHIKEIEIQEYLKNGWEFGFCKK